MRQQPPINPAWWREGTIDGVPLLQARARQDVAAVFRFLHARGWSRSAIAAATGLAESRVRRISQGRQAVTSYEVLERIAVGLGIERGWMGLAYTGPVNASGERAASGGQRDPASVGGSHGLSGPPAVSTVEDMDRRGLLAGTPALAAAALFGSAQHPDGGWQAWDRLTARLPSAPSIGGPAARVALADVEHVETVTETFRNWSFSWGGGMALAAAHAQLQQVISTARTATFDQPQLRPRLLLAIADLAHVAGFASYDAERHDEAHALLLVAVDAAQEAGNADMAAWALLMLAHQALHLGRPHDAVRITQMAQVATSNTADQLTLAAVDAHDGWFSAAAGHVQHSERALATAEERFSSAEHSNAQPWLRHLSNPAHQAWLRGRAYQSLIEHQPSAAPAAERLLVNAVDAWPGGRGRGQVMSLIALATTRFQHGENVGGAVDAGREALSGIAALNVPRVRKFLQTLEQASGPHAAHSDVAELRHQVGAALTAV